MNRLPLLLRLAAAACALMAVAAPPAPEPAASVRTTIFVLDVSASVSPGAIERAVAAIERAAAASPPSERVSVVAFAGRAEMVVPPSRAPRGLLERLTSHFKPDDSECAALPPVHRLGVEHRGLEPDRSDVRAALARAAAAGADRIVLLTDGNLEKAPATVERAVPLRGGWEDDAIALGLEVPPRLRSGEAFDAVLRVRSGRDVKTTAMLTIDERVVVASQPVELRGGRETLVRFRGLQGAELEKQGLHAVRAYVKHDDARPRNNRAAAVFYVQSRPRALVAEGVAGDGAPFDKVLAAQGLEVEKASAAKLEGLGDELAEFDVIVLSMKDVSALTEGAAKRLATAVRDGAGLWWAARKQNGAQTPPEALREILPVAWKTEGKEPGPPDPKQTDPPVSVKPKHKKVEAPPVALLLLIDVSGSMAGENLALAKEACLATAETLSPHDVVGVMGFNDRPFSIAPFARAGRRSGIERGVLSARANGGTDIAAGLAGGAMEIANRPESIRHIILMSDGKTEASDWERLLTAIRKAKITVTTVCVGMGTGTDASLMGLIASETGGRFIFSADFKSVPKIFTREARRLVKEDTEPPEDPGAVEPPSDPPPSDPPPADPGAGKGDPVETPRRVTAKDPHEALTGIEAFPNVWGMVAVEARPTATTALEGGTLPLLVSWRVGLGKTAAWMSEFDGGWGREWAGKPPASKLIGQMARWLRRVTEGPEPVPALSGPDAEGRWRFRIEAAGAEPLAAQVLTPEARDLELLPAGGSAVEGTFKPPEPDVPYRLRVTRGGRAALFGVIESYPGEQRVVEADESFFERPLELEALEELWKAPPRPSTRAQAVAGGWLVAAALLMLAGVGARRWREEVRSE